MASTSTETSSAQSPEGESVPEDGGDHGASQLLGERKGRKMLEALISRIDESEPLNKIGQSVSEIVGKVIKPGRVKDLVSGTWLGHPAHPMMTDLPIGFWTSSFLLDLLGKEEVHAASDALVGMGVVAAIPTAITGLSDLADVGEDEGLKVGTVHALGNTAALVCYAMSFVSRQSGNRRTGILWSTAGAGLATVGGYFGGHLAYRRGIGVNQTAFEKPLEEWTEVLDEGALPEGKPQMARVEGDDIFLYRTGEKVCAIANRCSHRGGPLNEGEVKDGTVTCPWHQSTFSLEDGSVINGPATAPQPAYTARLREGKVEIRSGR